MSMHKGLIGKSEGGGSVSPTYEDKTLGDYIARKQRQAAFDDVAKEKKLTFDEWFNQNFPYVNCEEEGLMRWAWTAAQENK